MDGAFSRLLDPRLRASCDKLEELEIVVMLAILCLHPDPMERPPMDEVQGPVPANTFSHVETMLMLSHPLLCARLARVAHVEGDIASRAQCMAPSSFVRAGVVVQAEVLAGCPTDLAALSRHAAQLSCQPCACACCCAVPAA